jgi:hypothetical protein
LARYPQNEQGKGSLRLIQKLINDCHQVVERKISEEVPDLNKIRWVSPLREDEFSEYRDMEFFKRLGLADRCKLPLQEFWPRLGPQWDALGLANDETILLVEAKANIPELASPGTKAEGASLELIKESLAELQKHLGVTAEYDWTNTYYQYTNRLAHLYYLREKNGLPAYLLNIYFIGDTEVSGPATREEWQEAVKRMKQQLGLQEVHVLTPFMIDLFVHVDEIYENKQDSSLN